MFEEKTMIVCSDCNDYLRFEDYGSIIDIFNYQYGRASAAKVYKEVDLAHEALFQDRQVIYNKGEKQEPSFHADTPCEMCGINLYGDHYLVNLNVRRNDE